MTHLTFNSSEQEANKCCEEDHLCTSTMQELWNLIFKAMARLGALISILDLLRAHLHARIKATASLPLSRQQESTGTRMQKGKYNQPCHDLGMPELRNVLYGPLTRDLSAEATESRHQKFQGEQ